jgi:hypothetical protein
VAVAGLYVCTNLNTRPDPTVTNDTFELIATTPVSSGTSSASWGLYDGGSVAVPGTRPGQEVLLQVRVWGAELDSYQKALEQAEPLVAVSDLLGPIVLGGGGLLQPALSQSTNLRTTALLFLRGTHAPVALDAAFSGPANTTISGLLRGSDPDGDTLRFSLVIPPTIGTVTVETNGTFSYHSLPNTNGTDSLTFKVSDGDWESRPATVTILVFPPSTFGGQVVFRNNSYSPVIDGRTGLPVEPGVVVAGLYYTTDLNAVPNLHVPKDSFNLVAVTPVSPSSSLRGIYSGGTVTIPGVPVGTLVVLQVRVWPVAYVSYEDAMKHGANLVGGSNLAPVFLGAGSIPIPNTSVLLQGIILGPPDTNQPPTAQDGTFTVCEDTPLTNQLPALDLDGDPLIFSLVSNVTIGSLTIGTNGQFTYLPLPNKSGTASFSFRVNDGSLESAPATIQLSIIPVNDPPVAVIQIAPLSSLFDADTNLYILSPNNTNATVLLDGSLCWDVETDPLSYAWFTGPDLWPVAAGESATVELAVGQYTMTLLVDDGQDTSTAQVTLEIITPGTAVDQLIARVETSDLESSRKKSLLASLQAAAASFDRDQFKTALNQLGAFLDKVRSQVAPRDPVLADRLSGLAREIMQRIH